MKEVRPLRAYADVQLGRQRSPKDDVGPHMVPYLRAANVKDGELDLSDVKEMNFSPDEQRRFALKPGDVLVSEGSGSLAAVGASAVWRGEISGTVCFQNTLLRVRPRATTDARFLAWWCRHAFADGMFASVATGANIYHLSAERLRDLPMTFLAIDRQRAIADVLDVATARIDELIVKKQRLIELARERFGAQLERDLRSLDCEWVPLKYFVGFREGPGILAADFTDVGVPLLRLANIVDGTVVLEGCGHLDQAMVRARWAHLAVKEGELLISGSAASVWPAVVPSAASGAIPYTGLIRLWPLHGDVDREFLRYFLASDSFTEQVDRLKTGIGLQHWGPSHLARVRMPVPEPGIQSVLVEAWEQKSRSVSNAEDALRRQVRYLQEHRQVLITAAVTGEIDVPGVAA